MLNTLDARVPVTLRVGLIVALCVTAVAVTVAAQAPGGRGGPASMTLPLANLGLEHLDIVVPDTAESAKFYMRIFKAPLHQQPVRDTLRYFLVLGDVPADRQVGYVAIGAASGRPAAIGHYCVLAGTYGRKRSRRRSRPRASPRRRRLPVRSECGPTPTVSNCSCFSRQPAW